MTSWRLCYWVANTRASVCVRAPTHVRQRVCVCERFCHSCRCVCLCWLLINMQHTHADRSLTSSKCRCLAPAISLADGPLNAGSGWRRWGRWVICVRWVGAINTSARYFWSTRWQQPRLPSSGLFLIAEAASHTIFASLAQSKFAKSS